MGGQTWVVASASICLAGCSNLWGFDTLSMADAASGTADATLLDDGNVQGDEGDAGRVSLADDAEAGLAVCAAPRMQCGDAGCADPSTPSTCGACGNACAGATPVCAAIGGTFACVAACPSSSPTSCSGTCVDTSSDPNHCGSCSNACSGTTANAIATCQSGTCSSTCVAGYNLCNGTCVDFGDPSNCGHCGNACTGATPLCASSSGTYGCVSSCSGSTMACNGSCVDMTSSVTNCGTCGNVCPAVANGQPACVGGTCTASCGAGYTLCGGACVSLTTAMNCGACATSCSVDGGTPVCSPSADGGTYSCVTGCSGSTPSLCGASCVDKTSDVHNCGTCGNTCTTNLARAQPVCSASACTFACSSPYALCNGACVDTTSDATNCNSCGHICSTQLANGVPACSQSACTATCSNGYTLCNGACVAEQTDRNNCGGCGSNFACPAEDTCMSGQCVAGATSTASYVCPFGSCNGSTSECTSPGGCFCSSDSQCKSGKCVKITGDNDLSCAGNCTGTGPRDGFDCELASPGIPALVGAGYGCPTSSAYKNTSLSCDSTHTNCFCTADAQCPSGKCIASANNAQCSPGGPCTGSGTADYRGCQAEAAIPNCPIYIGCPANTACSYPTCHCTSDVACASGHCIPNGTCSTCTGTSGAADDGHGCELPPSSIPCVGSGGGTCTTTLVPAPVLNAGQTACLCVADSDCSSGKCVNAAAQCTGTCTGSGTSDSNACQTAASIANKWSCPIGNCSNVTAPTGQCTAAGIPCWCTSDAQCSGGHCVNWPGCSTGACTGTGGAEAGVDAFNCGQ